jgi:hypothetical protein
VRELISGFLFFFIFSVFLFVCTYTVAEEKTWEFSEAVVVPLEKAHYFVLLKGRVSGVWFWFFWFFCFSCSAETEQSQRLSSPLMITGSLL